MTFYITYNPTLNNFLLGLSEDEPLNLPEGAAVKARAGDIPDISKMAYNPATLSFYERHNTRTLSKLAYLRRFTGEERVTIRTVAKTNPVLEDYMALLELSEEISLDDPDTIAAVKMLEGAGLIAAGRAAEILA